MPKRSSKPDENEMAFDGLQELLRRDEARDKGQPIDAPAEDTIPEKNPAAVALGRLGGLKGGKARAAKLSATKRRQIAKKAANARWAKKNKCCICHS
jgi:hypothetical protein